MANDAASLFSSIGKLNPASERANQYGPTTKRLGKGSLIQFTYNFAKPSHDRTPLVVVTDIMPAYIRGINLHYITFPTIKKISISIEFLLIDYLKTNNNLFRHYIYSIKYIQ